MDLIKQAQMQISSWWQTFDYCFNHNPGALLCEAFWTRLIGVFVVLGGLCVVVGVWKYVRFRRAYAAAIRAQWLRDSVNEAGIRDNLWNGDKAYQTHLPHDEVLAQIRSAVEDRKRQGTPASPNS